MFERWGFSRVIIPAFEYEEVLALGLGDAAVLDLGGFAQIAGATRAFFFAAQLFDPLLCLANVADDLFFLQPLGAHAVAPQATTGPGYGSVGETAGPGSTARVGEGAGDENIHQGGRPGQ